MKARIKNPDLARLFENTFPSTLDTTVKYFDPTVNLAFIVTGVSIVATLFIRVNINGCIGHYVSEPTEEWYK